MNTATKVDQQIRAKVGNTEIEPDNASQPSAKFQTTDFTENDHYYAQDEPVS